MHGLTSKNTNEESPAAPSMDIKSFAPATTEMFHTPDGHDDLNKQMRMIDLTEEDLRLLRLMKPVVEQRIDDITNQFYNTVLGVNKLEAIILEHSSIDRLKKTLREHIIEIFDGNVNEEYIAKRLKIANIHKRIGLEPKWYLSAFQNLQNVFITAIYNETHTDAERIKLVLEEYEKENIREKEEQYLLVKNELKHKIAEFSGELIDLSIDTNAAVEQLVTSSNEVDNTFQRTAASALESQGKAREGHGQLNNLTGQINLIYAK